MPLLGLLFKGTGQWKRVIYTRLFLQFGNLSIKIYKEGPLILVVIIHNILYWGGLKAPIMYEEQLIRIDQSFFNLKSKTPKLKTDSYHKFSFQLINTISALHMTSS